MVEHDNDRDGTERGEPEGIEDFGTLLKRLRGELSLRDVNRLCGVSGSYLSQIERGQRMPGRTLVLKLAEAYGVDGEELLRRAGHTGQPAPNSRETLDVERAFLFVLADPDFRVGTRPDGPLSTNSKRFIVEMYEKFTGKRLLE